MAPIPALLIDGVARGLAQSAAVVHDTIMIRPAGFGFLERIAAISNAIITIALMILAIVAVPIAWHFRTVYRKVNLLLDRVERDIAPIVRNATSITDNVNVVTTSIRTDVQKVNATINSANDRVQQAMVITEDRLNEFNALLAVVQEEAERMFLSTASTMRGVRTGAAAFRDRSGMDFASDELDPADVADAIERQLDGQMEIESQEEVDGDDSDSESAAQALPTAPRLRPRARRERRV
jgi:uncharacterized protein YoxC